MSARLQGLYPDASFADILRAEHLDDQLKVRNDSGFTAPIDNHYEDYYDDYANSLTELATMISKSTIDDSSVCPSLFKRQMHPQASYTGNESVITGLIGSTVHMPVDEDIRLLRHHEYRHSGREIAVQGVDPCNDIQLSLYRVSPDLDDHVTIDLEAVEHA